MKHNASTLGRRAAAAAGVLTLALLGLAPTAHAEDPNYGNIKENAIGSLTIHKHLNGGGRPIGRPDGSAWNPKPARLLSDAAQDNAGPAVQAKPFLSEPNIVQAAQGDAVAGVQFTAYPIQEIDLTTSEGWTKVNDLTAAGAIPDNACANPAKPTLPGYSFDTANAKTSPDTNDQGEAKIENLPVKAYLVCETKTPGDIVQKAKPFVVTIPYPFAEEAPGQWIYDVHVYPKNEKIEVSKTIEDQASNGYAVGAKVRFPVSSTLPELDEKSYYKYFQLKDTLDQRLTGVTATNVTLAKTPLAENTDYTLNVDGQTVTVTFTASGLEKLKAGAGETIQAVFEGTVSAAGDGNINNTAQLISDTTYAEQPPTPETPPTNPNNPPTTEQVTTKWGDLTIKKVDGHDAQASKAGLKGAEFQLFKAKNAYDDKCSKEAVGDAISVDGKTTLTTAEDGTISIAGLFVSDSVEGSDRDNQVGATTRCYVLIETKAPAGFALPAGDDAMTAVKVQAGAVTTDNVSIDNFKQRVPGLPLTGANGMLILTASGAALLMIAVGSVLVARYRERKRAADLAV
ncbi:SpaH/EbpB family LPXTG-anchored major pilin [Actinomyces viscosus]|uniref:SpaH/EbpB family LPXTG-anchored major pilin n=1 Tax=Actinomyces viscosus TaxID=1656 RepID=UPI0028E2E68C|nr:SpaH/EbpB family LPXTG-anchored major pilin [Actinomyces viscosus]